MPSFNNAPTDIGSDTWEGVRSFCRSIASVVNRQNQGKCNDVYRVANADFTLTANAASTVLTDPRLTVFSHVSFDPMTANAAAEIGAGTIYITSANRNPGAFTVTHNNSAQADRTFRVLIRGAFLLPCLISSAANFIV